MEGYDLQTCVMPQVKRKTLCGATYRKLTPPPPLGRLVMRCKSGQESTISHQFRPHDPPPPPVRASI